MAEISVIKDVRCGADPGERLLKYNVSPDLKTNRTLRHIWNECVTRYKSFRINNMLPLYFLYVIRPLAVCLIPSGLLCAIKKKRLGKDDS